MRCGLRASKVYLVQDHYGCVRRDDDDSPMYRVDHGVVDHRRIAADLNDVLSTRDPTSSQSAAREPRGRSAGPTRQEPERARTGKGHAAAGGCVFRRNMGLFPFATRFARASQLAFVASPPTSDLAPGRAPRRAALDHAHAHALFFPIVLSSFRTTRSRVDVALNTK